MSIVTWLPPPLIAIHDGSFMIVRDGEDRQQSNA